MAIVNSRASLKEYCLRRLGKPVLIINVDDDQLDDRMDEAIQFMRDYHYDASHHHYMKHLLTKQDVDQQYIDLSLASGAATTVAGSNTVLGSGTIFATEFGIGTIIQIGGETKTITAIANNNYLTVDSAFINYNNVATISNLTLPNAILGVTRVLPLTSDARVNMFDLRYQMRLNELWDFTSTSYVSFTLTMQHLRMLELLFVGEMPIRFNRTLNRLYIDGAWGTALLPGQFIIIEGFKLMNPDDYPTFYNDRFLKRYVTVLFKEQWATNLSKFDQIKLPGGVIMDGHSMYKEAVTEKEALEQEIRTTFEEPPQFFVG